MPLLYLMELQSHHNRERDGFGCQTTRFRDEENVLPGPGSYYKDVCLTWQKESLSRKGYGFLASANNRFYSKISYTGPGPGGEHVKKCRVNSSASVVCRADNKAHSNAASQRPKQSFSILALPHANVLQNV